MSAGKQVIITTIIDETRLSEMEQLLDETKLKFPEIGIKMQIRREEGIIPGEIIIGFIINIIAAAAYDVVKRVRDELKKRGLDAEIEESE